MSDATDVLQAVDQLRRDLSGYHGQLKAHNDLQRHCDHQRERIAELEAIHARDKTENAKLRELVVDYERCTMHADCSRCEYDGKLSTHCPLSPCFPDTEELRELGEGVDA